MMPEVSGLIHIWRIGTNGNKTHGNPDYVYTQEEDISEAVKRATELFKDVVSVTYFNCAI